MKKGYWVVAYRSISDGSAVKAYGALAVPALQSFGARFLTGSASQMQVYEAGLKQRTILVEFDSYDIARSAHESAAYQKALQALGSCNSTRLTTPQERKLSWLENLIRQ
jgi:uncharacterized protein (DUF1330 family)